MCVYSRVAGPMGGAGLQQERESRPRHALGRRDTEAEAERRSGAGQA